MNIRYTKLPAVLKLIHFFTFSPLNNVNGNNIGEIEKNFKRDYQLTSIMKFSGTRRTQFE